MGYSLWKIKKNVFSLLLFHWRCPSTVLLLLGLWSMVGSGRMPPGLSGMYEFVSFSVRGGFFVSFFFLFVEADLRHLSQSDKSKTQKSEQGEKHTNKDCLFVYLEKKVSQVTEVFSVEMRWLFIWCCFFLLPQRPDNCIHLLNCTWVFILPSLSSSDVKGLGMVSAELF